MRLAVRKKTTLQVPFYHQLDPATGLPEEYRQNGCAIVCMKMVLEYIFNQDMDINDLYERTEKAGGRNARGDWTHTAEVNVLKSFGLLAWRRNWSLSQADKDYFRQKEDYDESQIAAVQRQSQASAMAAITNMISRGYPVIVSVKKHFVEDNKRHQVVIVGFDQDNLYINDPIVRDSTNHPVKISKKAFLEAFNYQAIFVSRG